MDTYKHSCPFCGQHIEYTAGYCGQQMQCPICAKTITFPAIPPGGKRQALHIKRDDGGQRAKFSFSLAGILSLLRGFEHWNLVLLGLVPFVIVAVLLVGAKVVKNNAGEGPALPVAPQAQADPGAWQRLTDLARADQVVQAQLAVMAQDAAAVAAAQLQRSNLDNTYRGRTLDPVSQQSVQREYNAVNQTIGATQAKMSADRQSFETAFDNYQRLGGKVDYRQQLPR